uniref:Uncharacterized protein n=1 Tax=Romanomermis culicivorax TaxID=13658 RepID=A0A915K367_ROMCU
MRAAGLYGKCHLCPLLKEYKDEGIGLECKSNEATVNYYQHPISSTVQFCCSKEKAELNAADIAHGIRHYNDEASFESYLHLRRIEENDEKLLLEISDGLEVNLETEKCTEEVDTIQVQVSAFEDNETIGNKSNINKNKVSEMNKPSTSTAMPTNKPVSPSKQAAVIVEAEGIHQLNKD